MENLILLAGGASAGLLLWVLSSAWRRSGSASSAAVGPERFVVEPVPAPVRAALPLARWPAERFRGLAEGLRASGARADHPVLQLEAFLRRALVTAGNPGGLHPEEIVGLAAVCGLGAAVVAGLLAAATGYPVALAACACAAVGLAYPFLWLSDRVKRRQVVIRNNLPYMLDVLTLCIESGLDFTTALARVVPKFQDTALGYELGVVLREVRIGKPRADSLRDLAWRVNLGEVTTVVGAIIQAERLGTSVGPSLRIQSEEARRRRSLRAEELAMKAPVKLLFPLVAFIFPTTFLVIFAPVFIKNMPLLQRLGH